MKEVIPVIRWFLKDLSEKYGNAGCNDVDRELKELLTDDVKALIRPYMGDDEDEVESGFRFDFVIVHAIRAYLKDLESK